MRNPMKATLFGMGLCSALALLLLMGGCSLAPQYRKPDLTLPDHFKEERISGEGSDAPANSGYGAWQPARPSEQTERGEWWKIFHDSRLDDYEEQALHNNPGLQAAVARVKESRALLQKARSAQFRNCVPMGWRFRPRPCGGRRQALVMRSICLGECPTQSRRPPPRPNRARHCFVPCVSRFRRMSLRVISIYANWTRSSMSTIVRWRFVAKR